MHISLKLEDVRSKTQLSLGENFIHRQTIARANHSSRTIHSHVREDLPLHVSLISAQRQEHRFDFKIFI